MLRLTRPSSRLGIGALAMVLGIGAWTATPAPAAAQFLFGPRYYAPLPYYYPPPAYYPYSPPPPAYYPPTAPAYGAAPPATGAPPVPAYGAAPPAIGAPPASPTSSTAITYTDRPAFRNAAGQTCREYRGANGALGSACQDSTGQWRVAN
jgi:hypothetical protein